MKARIVIPLVLMGLFSVGSAYALTQAENLSIQAEIGNAKDLVKLESMAKSGNAVAQRWLGGYWSIKQDSSKAIYWYKKSAEQGNAEAEWFLGLRYAHGKGVPQNYPKANYWFKKAAVQGGSAGRGARLALDSEHEHTNTGTQADLPAKVALRGNMDAMKAHGNAASENNLGADYYKGQGVPQSYAKADYWFRKAAVQGNVDAESNLGNSYYFGYGMAQDYAKAIYWFRKAAAHGNVDAEINLGQAYYYGYGVPQDCARVIYWFRKAAGQGSATAQHNLDGIFYGHTHCGF